ncbi:MAG: tRNA lysidine(34) synthetase TilS [Mycoplasma sp.]|nr:tRNA lysidine(34) synthetase TilS [Mycoplasma sp.]
MKILGVSGGPDSMLLLSKNQHKKIIVAHVNYNVRKTSKEDEKLVEKFCKERDIPFFLLNLKEKPDENFQAWARKKRFDFFKNLYDKYQCKSLLLGHHKDDFLETAIMQINDNRKPKQFGIKRVSIVNGMKIMRPFIKKYWKQDILNICERLNIPYVIDVSNSETIYTRNQVRKEIEKLTPKEKKDQFSWFQLSNRILDKKNKKVNIYYKKWCKSNFSLFTFGYMKFKNELVFNFLHDNNKDIKVSSNKIKSIIQWIEADNSKREYKIKDKVFIKKENKVIKIITKK